MDCSTVLQSIETLILSFTFERSKQHSTVACLLFVAGDQSSAFWLSVKMASSHRRRLHHYQVSRREDRGSA